MNHLENWQLGLLLIAVVGGIVVAYRQHRRKWKIRNRWPSDFEDEFGDEAIKPSAPMPVTTEKIRATRGKTTKDPQGHPQLRPQAPMIGKAKPKGKRR